MELAYQVEREEACRALMAHGAFAEVGPRVAQACPGARVFVVTDATVADLYLDALLAQLQAAGLPVLGALVVPAGDGAKCLATAVTAWDRLVAADFARRDVLLALGGGMVTDLTGFVAATFMRGVAYVNVPTSLLAQVDAAFGGKVAVNHERTKNLLGAFHHPRAVIVDPHLLRSLPPRVLRAGVAEAIKAAVVGSAVLFGALSASRTRLLGDDPEVFTSIISEAVRVKMDLVLADPFEQELDRALNLGHTLGHALEALTPPEELLHGEAVGVGMALACLLAQGRGLCPAADARALLDCLAQYHLLQRLPEVAATALWAQVDRINLIRGRRTRWVLPAAIGRVDIVSDVEFAEFDEAWAALRALSPGAPCPPET